MLADPLVVRNLFTVHYFMMAFILSLGALQIAVSTARHSGLYIVPFRKANIVCGIMLFIGGPVIFFTMPLWVEGPWASGSVAPDSSFRMWGKAEPRDLGYARNVNDVDGGLNANTQAWLFPAAAGASIAVSLLFGSVWTYLHRRVPSLKKPQGIAVDGLELLDEAPWPLSAHSSFRTFRRQFILYVRLALHFSPFWALPKIIKNILAK